jgi:N-acetylglutamate synthase-like GNAT family acetyltransferase
MNLHIVTYKPEYQPYFEQFNKAWLEEYFVVEPIDEYVLTHPEEAILKDGGVILFAASGENIIGTVALKYLSPGVYELTKMAVDKAWHGIGAGKLLCTSAIEKAKELQAAELILFSQSRLKAALSIYAKLGFVNIPVGDVKYKRADVKMKLVF